MDWFGTALGVALAAVVLRDIFHTIFHPSGQGTVSWLVMTAVWRLSRGVGGRRRLGGLAGPAAMVAVIGTWTGLTIAAWALIYWPHMPAGFQFSGGLQPGSRTGLVDALYLSMVTSATLGFGDIVPTDAWLRFAAPLQAMFGFGLLTSAVSWVLQIYPALSRRRVLALRLALLRRTAADDAVRRVDSASVAQLLADLATALVGASVDLRQYAETYYFRDDDPESSLAAMLGYAAHLSRAGRQSPREDVRTAAAVLGCALEKMATLLDEEFFRLRASPMEVFEAFATQHGHTLVRH